MKSLLKLPLHYQILIAMAAGTLAGLLLNPGDVELEGEVEAVIAPVDAAVAYAEIQSVRGVERALLRETIPDEEALRRRYPELARIYRAQEPRQAIDVQVTRPRVHIVEDGRTITIRYSRRLDGTTAVHTFEAANVNELAERYPQWLPLFEEHGGGVRRQVAAGMRTVGDLFLRMLKMITVPLIVTSLVTGVSGLGSPARFGSMFGRTLLYYGATSLLAITTGLVMVNAIRPGVGANLPGGGEPVAGEDESLQGVFLGMIYRMIPENPIQSLAQGEFLSIITFSILIGIFIVYVGGKQGELLRSFFEAAFAVMMKLTMAIIRLAPIGVFAFMLFVTATQGLDIFRTLAWYMVAVFLALAVHACVVLPLILKFVARRSPWQFAQAMSPALMTAFSTASSNATLPLTLQNVELRAGVPNRVSSFVLPLGATVNMDGTALYEAVAVLFIAQAYAFADPTFALTLDKQIMVAVTALLASVGAAGIPHAGLVMMAIVLQAVGLPLEAQGVIIAVDRVLDMCRTAVNVWSDSCGCAVLARFEGPVIEEAPAVEPASPAATPEAVALTGKE
jgi:proton glutamate symport protein